MIEVITKALPECKIACEQNVKCNIINIKDSGCVMKACPTPIPEPLDNGGNHVGYTGYKLTRGKIISRA